MEAKGKHNIKACNNAVYFIYKYTLNWVDTSRKILKYESAVYKDKIVRPLQNSGLGLNNYYVKELALALHSLQDSFSPAHTQRYHGGKCLVTKTVHDLKKSMQILFCLFETYTSIPRKTKTSTEIMIIIQVVQ